jgi:hypothetical protein
MLPDHKSRIRHECQLTRELIPQIRISIYALCLGAGILKTVVQHITSQENYAEFVQVVNSGLQLQGLALLLTAIVQTFEQQLTLFHALCVLHLLALLGFGLVAQRRYGGSGSAGLRRWVVLALARVVIACAFIALTAYIWLTAKTFGSQPECNASTFYVVFGVKIHATDDVFRYIVLALLASMAVGWVLSMVFAVVFAKCCFAGRHGVRNALVAGGRGANAEIAVFRNVLGRIRITDPRHRENAVKSQIVELLIHTGVNVYMIATLEEIVNWNTVDEAEKEWTFGQILAVFVLLGVVVEVVNILLSKLDATDSDAESLNSASGGMASGNGTGWTE